MELFRGFQPALRQSDFVRGDPGTDAAGSTGTQARTAKHRDRRS